jgi:uncharacterized protein VirK/YbjX
MFKHSNNIFRRSNNPFYFDFLTHKRLIQRQITRITNNVSDTELLGEEHICTKIRAYNPLIKLGRAYLYTTFSKSTKIVQICSPLKPIIQILYIYAPHQLLAPPEQMYFKVFNTISIKLIKL